MKRLTVCLVACLVLAGGGWLAHSVLAQAADNKDQTVTMTRAQWKELLDKAIAADREKYGRGAGAPATDQQVLNPQNWHRAVFNQAEWVVYTGPGQAMFHHWVEQKAPVPPAKSGASAPAGPTGK